MGRATFLPLPPPRLCPNECVDTDLFAKIIAGWAANAAEEAKLKRHRLGYMGYLINMCQGIQKIKPPREPAPLYLPTESTTLEDWLSFCTESLRPAVELQSTPLVRTPSSLPFILSTDVQKAQPRRHAPHTCARATLQHPAVAACVWEIVRVALQTLCWQAALTKSRADLVFVHRIIICNSRACVFRLHATVTFWHYC